MKRSKNILLLTGHAPSFLEASVLYHSLKVLEDSGEGLRVKSTGVPSFVADTLLAIKDLNHQRKERRDMPRPFVIYEKVKKDSSAGFARPSDLLTFLLRAYAVGERFSSVW